MSARVLGVVVAHECDEHCKQKAKKAEASGPAKVNSPEYIREYERIFGGKAVEGKA